MPHSFATTANLTCTACTRSFSAELWLIVDTVERPDLLARIRAAAPPLSQQPPLVGL